MTPIATSPVALDQIEHSEIARQEEHVHLDNGQEVPDVLNLSEDPAARLSKISAQLQQLDNFLLQPIHSEDEPEGEPEEEEESQDNATRFLNAVFTLYGTVSASTRTTPESTPLNTPSSTLSVAGRTKARRRRRRIRPSHRGWRETPFDDLDGKEIFPCEPDIDEDAQDSGSDASSDSGMPAREDQPESLTLGEGFEDPEDMLDESPARLAWLRQKRDENAQNEHIDRIMSMIGREQVKAHFLAIKERVDVARRWGEDTRALNFNLVLHGSENDGTWAIHEMH